MHWFIVSLKFVAGLLTFPANVRHDVPASVQAAYQCDGAKMEAEWKQHERQVVADSTDICVVLGRFGYPDEIATSVYATVYSWYVVKDKQWWSYTVTVEKGLAVTQQWSH